MQQFEQGDPGQIADPHQCLYCVVHQGACVARKIAIVGVWKLDCLTFHLEKSRLLALPTEVGRDEPHRHWEKQPVASDADDLATSG